MSHASFGEGSNPPPPVPPTPIYPGYTSSPRSIYSQASDSPAFSTVGSEYRDGASVSGGSSRPMTMKVDEDTRYRAVSDHRFGNNRMLDSRHP
jgi:hypothetical protein